MAQPSENEIAVGFIEAFDPEKRAQQIRRQAFEEVATWLERDRGALALAQLLREKFLPDPPHTRKRTPE